MHDQNQQVLNAYLALWANPFPPRNLDALDTLTTGEVRFKDPINDVAGRIALKAIFQDASEAVANTQIDILGVAWAAQDRAFVKWRYAGQLRRLNFKPWQVSGMSDIAFSADGLITSHEDHWDLAGGLFEHFPLIGWLFRRLRQRLRVPGQR